MEAVDYDGRSGWGEAPISRVTRLSTEQAVASVQGTLAALVLGAEELDGVLARLERSSEPAAARMAVDCALHDLAAQQLGLTLGAYLGGAGAGSAASPGPELPRPLPP